MIFCMDDDYLLYTITFHKPSNGWEAFSHRFGGKRTSTLERHFYFIKKMFPKVQFIYSE